MGNLPFLVLFWPKICLQMVKNLTQIHFKKHNLVTPQVFRQHLEAVQTGMRVRVQKQGKNTLLFSRYLVGLHFGQFFA